MNLRLMDRLDGVTNGYVLAAQRWVEGVGRGAFPPKLWYMGKIPYHPGVWVEAVADIKAALSGIAGRARKLLLLDLDDTLWGGIVGDVGWENLQLGGHDSVGEAFVDFQNAIKSLQRRGVVLGVVSKNTEEVALEAIRRHPAMVLRETDFVGHRINWRDKAQNVAELVEEVNLGLQSVVFIDDNPVERARDREALPEVFVPEWPEDKTLYASALRSLRCFDSPAISREDLDRTRMYSSERQRESLKAEVGSVDDWLKQLAIKVVAEPLKAENLARTTQLLNKTNQMNLSTRRLSEQELLAWVKDGQRQLWAVRVSDRFGDAGLTGIVSLELDGSRANVVDFVLSCRVMGRRIEETMAHLLVEEARRCGATSIEARYLATAKNKPCLEFWERSGFEAKTSDYFAWNTTRAYPCPSVVEFAIDP
jgi:FkbH-like protein